MAAAKRKSLMRTAAAEREHKVNVIMEAEDSGITEADLRAAHTKIRDHFSTRFSQVRRGFMLLDEDNSGEIDAKELENALRQWRRDFSDEHAHPKPHEMSKNHALMAAKAARARLHEKSLREPADGFDPIALCFSYDWLPTLDTFLAKRTGPQDGHARRAVAREALRIKRERRAAALEASVTGGGGAG